MPIYEYECDSCGQHFERFQSVQDAPLRQCPQCSGPVHKVFHPVGIVFKGSGWYITDGRKATSTSEDKSESKSDTAAKTATSTAKTTST